MKFRGSELLYQVWSSTGQGKSEPGPRFRRLQDAVRFVNDQERGSHAIKAPDGTFHEWPDGTLVLAKGSGRGPAVRAPTTRRRRAFIESTRQHGKPSTRPPSRPSAARGTQPPRSAADAGDPANRRKLPRTDFDCIGELELRAKHGDAKTLPCTIFSVSPSGIGCVVAQGALPAPGTRVTARFSEGEREFELAGRVVWSGGEAERARGVGVALQLELAPAIIRREFAHWVIGKLRTSY